MNQATFLTCLENITHTQCADCTSFILQMYCKQFFSRILYIIKRDFILSLKRTVLRSKIRSL